MNPHLKTSHSRRIKRGIEKENWIWMPHPAHFICADKCRFFLATVVGKYIISTVGEYWPDSAVRKIHAEIHDKDWLSSNSHLLGDSWDAAYFRRFGFEELGLGRTYETMVFKCMKNKIIKCCPFSIMSGESVDFNGYKTAIDAYNGHINMCNKWAKK